MRKGFSYCELVVDVSPDGFHCGLGLEERNYELLEGLGEYRWSERPFDSFEDGKECVIEEGGADE